MADPAPWGALLHDEAVAPRRARWERRALLVARRMGHEHRPHRLGRHHHARTPHAVAYLGLLFVLWLLNAADLAITLHHTGAAGWTAEGNAIMRTVAHIGGSWGFAVYKLVLMTMVVGVLWWLYLQVEDALGWARRPAAVAAARVGYAGVHALTAGLVAFYGWVVWNNVAIAGLG